MAAIRSASKRRREGGKIYVSGYVDGLETGYNYCVMYSYNGGAEKNMGNSGRAYTFINQAGDPKGSSTRYSFTDQGAWVTDEGDGTYEIICNMVGVDCEHVHIQESTRSFSVTTPYTPPPTPEQTPYTPPYTPPPAPSTCNEGETACEYNEAYSRYMMKKCVNGKMVFDRWCGTEDTCEGGVCISPPKPIPIPTPPACEEGTTVCEYHEGQKRYMLKKCISGKLVFERWCGADDTCENGVCVPKPKPIPIPTPPACEEGTTVCEYHEGQKRYMLKKCISGKLVFERWCGADDTCENGVCVPKPKPIPIPTPPACEEGTTVCEYHEGQKRYMLKKCISGKLVFERWCGADDTCENGVCISPPTPTPTEPAPTPTPTEPAPVGEKYLSPDEAIAHINAGRTCYIKCTLPILDTLPGIPYTPGAWVPPFCAITTKP